MVEIMPFGKYSSSSVEQIALKDYHYFKREILDKIPLKKLSLRERFNFVYFVANNFVPQVDCARRECTNKAQLISVYHGGCYGEMRSSSPSFIYCSQECFEHDPNVTTERQKVNLLPIRFDIALSDTKFDTNRLVEIFAECMGMKEGRRTKEYLDDFFNRCPTKVPYTR